MWICRLQSGDAIQVHDCPPRGNVLVKPYARSWPPVEVRPEAEGSNITLRTESSTGYGNIAGGYFLVSMTCKVNSPPSTAIEARHTRSVLGTGSGAILISDSN